MVVVYSEIVSAMDDEKADQLIILAAEYIELCDLQNKNYSNQQRKDNIWKEIALKLNETPERCKTKWINLRDGFQRAIKNVKTKSRRAANLKRKWRFYDAVSFLLPYLKNRDTHSNIDEVHLEHDGDTEFSDVEQGNESVTRRCITESEAQPRTPLSTVSVRISEKTESSQLCTVQRKRMIRNNQEEQDHMPQLFREFLEEKKSKRIERSAKPEHADRLEQFFICLSETVKTFPPLCQAQVKSKIFEIVNSTEVMLLSGNKTLTASTGFIYPQNTSQSASSQYTSLSTLQPILNNIPSPQTSTGFSTTMQASHTSADILNSSSSETTTYPY